MNFIINNDRNNIQKNLPAFRGGKKQVSLHITGLYALRPAGLGLRHIFASRKRRIQPERYTIYALLQWFVKKFFSCIYRYEIIFVVVLFMKSNAWHFIKPNDYDAHMSHPNVAQTQMLNKIIKEQFELLPKKQRSNSCVAILGITNGNGLEHVIPCEMAKVIGIDINKSFLDECRVRYKNIEKRLYLLQLDLTENISKSVGILSECNLIIANLLIKHIHLDNFIRIVAGLPKKSQIISCVIQINPDGMAVSKSGFEHIFEIITNQREDEKEDLIIPMMIESGFVVINRVVYNLPNKKQFIRLDFTTT